MNASYSAINKNVEMMLWLGTKNMYLNGDKFLEDIFCGPVGDAKNPFEQVTVADAVLETESDNRNLLEQKIKDLCRVKRQAVISEDNENAGKYTYSSGWWLRHSCPRTTSCIKTSSS